MPTASARFPFRAAALLASAAFQLHFIRSARFEAGGRSHFTLFDDAMISMRYARNLAEGHGLVWNPGGAPVEGYTNLLWTLWMAVPHGLGVPEQYTALCVMLSGALLLVACAVLAARVARALEPGGPAADCALLFVAGCYPLLYWTLRGMEVGLEALLLLFALGAALRVARGARARSAWPALAALPLVRADAALPAALIALATSGACWRSGRRAQAASLVSAVMLPVAGQLFFRWLYYGELLPNTYYLKLTGLPPGTSLARGLRSLWDQLGGVLAPWSLAAAAALWYRRRDARHWLVFSVFGAQCAYSVWAGGDAWEWMGYANRYLSAALPALSVLAAIGIQTLFGAGRPWTCRGVALALLLTTHGLDYASYFRDGYAHAREERIVGRLGIHLRETTAPEARIAVVWAGAIPYFARREVVDLLGKNDPVIAREPAQPGELLPGHNKWNYRYSIGELRPAVVESLWRPTPEDALWMRSQGYQQLRNGLWIDTAQRGLLREGIARIWDEALIPPAAAPRATP